MMNRFYEWFASILRKKDIQCDAFRKFVETRHRKREIVWWFRVIVDLFFDVIETEVFVSKTHRRVRLGFEVDDNCSSNKRYGRRWCEPVQIGESFSDGNSADINVLLVITA
jgi:hypothetical protein